VICLVGSEKVRVAPTVRSVSPSICTVAFENPTTRNVWIVLRGTIVESWTVTVTLMRPEPSGWVRMDSGGR
jgi:hypothetical protein